MDSLTQAVLGASIQGAGMSKYQGRKAYLYGAVLATLPDLDILIRYDNPVTKMTTHRGFSHSIFVLTIFAALLTWLAIQFRQRQNNKSNNKSNNIIINNPIPADKNYSWQRLMLTTWLTLITHPVLDSFTVYGTQLFWPFSFIPESWSSIFIIDPIYTVPLLIATLAGLIFGYRQKTQILSYAALIFSCSYLALSLWTKHLAENKAEALLNRAGIEVTRLKSMPMPLTIFLWQVFAEDEQNGKRYEVITGTFDRAKGEWREMPYHPDLLEKMKDNPDVARLRWFTDNWIDLVPENDQLILQDERMNSNGKAYFRFVIAEKDAQGGWQEISPKMMPKIAGGGDYQARLTQLWQRLKIETPFPYADWQS